MARWRRPKLPPSPKSKTDWREKRGIETRGAILDATVKCIVRDGYANLRTTSIAEACGVSRGAMLHHFPCKDEMVYATVEYLYEKRIRAYQRAVDSISGKSNRIRHGFDSYWTHVNHPYFIAFFELIVAARTDPELHQVMAPFQKRLEEKGLEHALRLFPEMRACPERLLIGLRLSNALMENMALNRVFREPGRVDQDARQFLERCLRDFYRSQE